MNYLSAPPVNRGHLARWTKTSQNSNLAANSDKSVWRDDKSNDENGSEVKRWPNIYKRKYFRRMPNASDDPASPRHRWLGWSDDSRSGKTSCERCASAGPGSPRCSRMRWCSKRRRLAFRSRCSNTVEEDQINGQFIVAVVFIIEISNCLKFKRFDTLQISTSSTHPTVLLGLHDLLAVQPLDLLQLLS